MPSTTYYLQRTRGAGFGIGELRSTPEYLQFEAVSVCDVAKYPKALVIQRMLEHGVTSVTVNRPHDLAVCSPYIVPKETDPALASSLRSAIHSFIHTRNKKGRFQFEQDLFAVPIGLDVPQQHDLPAALQQRGYFVSSYVPEGRLLLVPPDPVHSLEKQYSMEILPAGSARATLLLASDRLYAHTTVGVPMDYVDANRFVYTVHDGTVSHFLQRGYLTKNHKFKSYLATAIRTILLQLATYGYYLETLDPAHFVVCDWNRDKRRVLLLDTSAVRATDRPDPFRCSIQQGYNNTTDHHTRFILDRICTYHADSQKKQKKTSPVPIPPIPAFHSFMEEEVEYEDEEETDFSDPFEPIWQGRATERPLAAPTFQNQPHVFTNAPPCLAIYNDMVQDILTTYGEPQNPFTAWEVMEDAPMDTWCINK